MRSLFLLLLMFAGMTGQSTPGSTAGQFVPTGGRGASSVDPTLVSAWPSQDGSGLTLQDISGQLNPATINTSGAVTWQSNAGFPGTTPLWSGTGYATAAKTGLGSFNGTQPFWVAFWMIPTWDGSYHIMISNTTSGANAGWEIGTNNTQPNNNIVFRIAQTLSTNDVSIISSTSIASGARTFIVVSYDGTRTPAGEKVYVNGVLGGQSTLSNTFTGSSASSNPIMIGARAGTTMYKGVLGFISVHSGTPTQTQITNCNTAGPSIC